MNLPYLCFVGVILLMVVVLAIWATHYDKKHIAEE